MDGPVIAIYRIIHVHGLIYALYLCSIRDHDAADVLTAGAVRRGHRRPDAPRGIVHGNMFLHIST